MNKSFALFAGFALAAAGFLSSCDNYTTTPTASGGTPDTATQWTATLSFSPVAGTYPDAQSVVLTANDSTASIYYTTDNSIPTTASSLYKGAIPVNATTRIKAITVKGGVSSVVNPAQYIISVTTFKPAGGTYTSAQSVTLSTSDPIAAIYYTTDGSIPTRSSTLDTAPIPVKSTTTINAIAVTNGVSSTVSSATYTLPLLFAPAAGTFTGTQKVTLSTGTVGDTMFYTTDGSTPTASSTLYTTGTISVNSTTTIKAISVKAGKTSIVYSAAYTITVLSFKPAAGVYTRAQNVVLGTINTGDTIYYTTDGTAPTRSSTPYAGAIAVGSDDTIKAISVNGASTSPVYKAFYQFIPWQSGITYGSVSDAAGTAYRTVDIGSQTWMAENLNYPGTGSIPIGTCYKGIKDSCAKYGRLYTWDQAMNGTGSSSSGKVQGICPTSWHVPTDAEWTNLLRVVDSTNTTAGTRLKTRNVGWKVNGTTSGNGSDVYGFHALPSGDSIGVSNAAGSAGFWWSATEGDTTHAWNRSMYYNANDLSRYDYDKTFGFALRCVKD